MLHPGPQESPGLRRQRRRIDGLSVYRPHPVGSIRVTIIPYHIILGSMLAFILSWVGGVGAVKIDTRCYAFNQLTLVNKSIGISNLPFFVLWPTGHCVIGIGGRDSTYYLLQ